MISDVLGNTVLTVFVLDTGKQVLWQTVKTPMKCRKGGISSGSSLFAIKV